MKKFLSIALALAMTLSLAVVGASATEYKDLTDKASIKHTEAVTVMNKIGIISGYSDGSFKPAASITRGAAAKIICMAKLGTTTANSLSTEAAPFKDVSTANTFAAFIAYCSNTKVVNGYNDGSFRPSESVTGYAFAKMLLTAVGKTGTYTGTGWEINVATAAQDIGLFSGIDSTVVMSKPLSRDNACQMALNAMTYSATGATVYRVAVTTADGTTRNTTPVNYDFATSSEALSFFAVMNTQLDKTANVTKGLITNVAYLDKQTGSAADTLLKTNFGVTTNTATDKFGRPSNIYTKSSWTSDLVFPATADYTLTGEVTNAAMYAKVGVTPSTKYTWSAMVDGKTAVVVAPSKTGTGAYATTDVGSQTEVFVDSSAKTVTVVVTKTYIDSVAKITAKTDTAARSVTLANGLTFETESFAKGDVVLYTKANDAVQSMQTATVVTGKLEKVVTSNGVSTYTVAGKDYVVSENGTTSMTTANLNKDVSFYVDAQGNIMKDKDASDAALTYIYVLANADTKASGNYTTNTTTNYVTEVYGVTSDGKYGTYNIASTNGQYTQNASTLIGKVFVYTVDSTGLLTKGAEVATKNADPINVNDSKVGTAILNSATQFVFVETKSATDKTISSVSVKTGTANIGASIAADKAVVCAESNVAKVVFVTGAYTDSSTDSGKVAYVKVSTEKAVVTSVNGANVTSYTYTAYANDGTKLTLTSSSRIVADGVYKYTSTNTIGAEAANTTKGVVITAINGSAITLSNDKTLNVTDKTGKVFLGDDTDLKVGQTVTYVANATYASNFDAIFVTGDQATKTLTVIGGTTTTTDVITGAGVVNTISIKVSVAAADNGKTITVSGNSGTAKLVVDGAAVNSYTVNEKDVSAKVATITVTVTAPTANTTLTVTVA